MFDELELNVVSYTLLALILGLVIIPVLLEKDPDIHPLLLNRQSVSNPIRDPGESAIYRSTSCMHGYPLSGLRLPTEHKSRTRDGDMRDIWSQAVEKGGGKVLSIRGSDVKELDINQLTQHIYALGSYIKAIPGAKRVAIYLANDIENLVASFACAFYDLTLVVLPFDPKTASGVATLLKESEADVLIAPAGDLPLARVEGVSLKRIIYVVEPGSQHLDWTSPPGKVEASLYHDIIKAAGPEPGDVDLDGTAVIVFGEKRIGNESKMEMAKFSHRNITAGVASQVAAIREPLHAEDVFVPVDTLSDPFTRIFTYAALVSGATIALNPIAGSQAGFESTVKRARPTVVVASTATLNSLLADITREREGMWRKLIYYFQCRALESGRLPKGNTCLNGYTRPNVGTPSRLRMVFSAEAAGGPDPHPLSSEDLNDLRVLFGAKVVYGLKHHLVAGPITQQNPYDYRVQKQVPKPDGMNKLDKKSAHFGGVAPGCEVFTRDWMEYRASDKGGSRGRVFVRGSTAMGQEVDLGVAGKWLPEGVLSYP